MESFHKSAKIKVGNFIVWLSYVEGSDLSSVFGSGWDSFQFGKLAEFCKDLGQTGVFKIAVKYDSSSSAEGSNFAPVKSNSILIPSDLMSFLVDSEFLKRTGEASQKLKVEEERKGVKIDIPEIFGGKIVKRQLGYKKLFYCVVPNNWHRVNKGAVDSSKTVEEYRFQIAAYIRNSTESDEIVPLAGTKPDFFMNLRESEFDSIFLNPDILRWIQEVSQSPCHVEDHVDFDDVSRDCSKTARTFGFSRKKRAESQQPKSVDVVDLPPEYCRAVSQ